MADHQPSTSRRVRKPESASRNVALRVRRRILIFKYGRPLAILLLVVVISAVDRRGLLLAYPEDGHRYHLRETRVVRVIDGDTIEVDLPDESHHTLTTRVRIWGIDCPERAMAPVSGNALPQPAEPWSEEATEFTRALVEDRTIRLRIEQHRTRGAYGRLLAHIDIIEPKNDPAETSNEINLAVELLRAGLARRESRWLHSMMAYYEQVEHSARQRGKGIWSDQGRSSN